MFWVSTKRFFKSVVIIQNYAPILGIKFNAAHRHCRAHPPGF